jgi:hypothetical protein
MKSQNKRPRLILCKSIEYAKKARLKFVFKDCAENELLDSRMHAEAYGKKELSVKDMLKVESIFYQNADINTTVKALRALADKMEAIEQNKAL